MIQFTILAVLTELAVRRGSDVFVNTTQLTLNY